jgi:virulence plasmid B protein/VCBS repeat protein
VPIQVPPGVGGVEPKLSLAYNSRNPNGMLGVGWTLTGLPSITRCPQTMPQDGARKPVAYNAADRFCLDGQRLILTSGTYGVAGSTYATEIDSFVKITAVGSAGTGPQSFVAKTKDGQTVEFGNSTDSRIPVATQQTVRVWSLSKAADAFGNAQIVTYGLPPVIASKTSEYNAYPLSIAYTSNTAQGVAPTNVVEFNYATRTDVVKAYQGGRPFETSVRLSSLVTKTNGAMVTTYTPTYETTGGVRSIITSISQCGQDGLCAAATRFGIGSSSAGAYPAQAPAVLPLSQTESTSVNGKWQSLDLNGDGKTDLVHLTDTPGVYRSWLSNGDGTFTIREFTTAADTALGTGVWQILDVNSDGRADLIHMTTTSGLAKVWFSRGDGEFIVTDFSTTQDGDLAGGIWLAIDVNGDGHGDLIHLLPAPDSSEPMRVWKSNGDGTFVVTAQSGGGTTVFVWPASFHYTFNRFLGSKFQVFDADGDGLADIIELGVDDQCYGCDFYLRMNVRLSNGDGSFRLVSNIIRIWPDRNLNWLETIVPIDANQDGLMDFLWISNAWYRSGPNGPFPQGDNRAMLLVSKGDGTFESVPQPAADAEGSWLSVDVNGDGMQDLLHTPSTLNQAWYHVYRSNGDGSFAFSALTQSVDTCASSCGEYIKQGDFLGTGAASFVRVDGKTVKNGWFLSPPPSGLMTSVSNGLNDVTSWELAALPVLGGAYLRDIPSDQNTWTVAPPVPVVRTTRSRIASWNAGSGLSHLERTNGYSYGAARLERNGRGFLGFNWRETKDNDSGITSRSYYSHTFPATGRVVKQGIGTGVNGAWSNLSLETTDYSCTALDGTNACSVAPGKRYFVYSSLVDSQKRDLDGTALPTTQVINAEPDTFGNLKRTVTSVFNGDGSPSGNRKTVAIEFYNNDASWVIGRPIKSTVTSTDSDTTPLAALGAGNLPSVSTPVPPMPSPPRPPPPSPAVLMVILQLLLE